jgi:hypothetical protein
MADRETPPWSAGTETLPEVDRQALEPAVPSSRICEPDLDSLPYPIKQELELIHRLALRAAALTEQLAANLAAHRRNGGRS